MQSASANLCSSVRRAFTLIELLVVMGIITLIIAFALPAFRFMSGEKSVEAGQNVLAAMLGTARADAIGVQQPKGIVVYRESSTGRLAAAFVEFKQPPMAWAANTTYSTGDYVTQNSNTYACLLPNVGISATNDPATSTVYWQLVDKTANVAPIMAPFVHLTAPSPIVIDLVGDRDRVLMPTGIDVRGAGNTAINNGITSRYFNPTVVMFDSNGMLATMPFEILFGGAMASQMDKSTALPVFSTATPTAPSFYGNAGLPNVLTSQIGIVLFDDELFKNVNPSPVDSWIDTNSTPVMINRYNGTLVKGE